jgi:site-specific DNA recombinase
VCAVHLDQGPRHRHRQGHRSTPPEDTADVRYGALDEDEFVATKKTIKAELAVVRRKKTAAARDSRLAQLGTAPDPAAAFRKAGLAVRREVIDALADVVLHPSPRAGRHSGGHFDPSTIEVRWRS